jgi:hypothetical protein
VIKIAARGVLYLVFALLTLPFMGLFCFFCAIPGAIVGGISLMMLSVVFPALNLGSNADFWPLFFTAGGALGGIIIGLFLTRRFWWFMIKGGGDGILQGFLRCADELSCALIGRRTR